MNLPEYYHRTRQVLHQTKPFLLRVFEELTVQVAAAVPLSPEIMQAVNHLTLASEWLFVPPEAVNRAVRRNEFIPFAQVLSALSGSRSAAVFLYHYVDAAPPLFPLQDDLIALERGGRASAVTVHAVIAFVFRQSEPETARRLLNAFALIVAESPAALVEVFNLFQSRMHSVDFSMLLEWLSRGVDLLTSRRTEEGVRYLRLQSRESRRMLGIRSVVLGDIGRPLQIYAASLAGRSLAVRSADISTFGKTMPYSDGKTLFLPNEMHKFHDVKRNERIYSALTALQAASLSMGTYGFVLEEIDFMTALRERYATVLPDIMQFVRRQYGRNAQTIRERATGEIEVVYGGGRILTVLETPQEQFFYLFPVPDLAREIFRAVENGRIRSELARKYPGLAEDFLLLRDLYERNITQKDFENGDRETRFHLWLEILVRSAIAPDFDPGLRDALSRQYQEIREQLNRVFEPGATVFTSSSVCFELFNQFYDRFPVITYCERFDVRICADKGCLPEFCPEIVYAVSPEMIRVEKKADFFDSFGQGVEREIDLASVGSRDARSDDLRRELDAGNISIYRYPEYDYRRGAHLEKHCTLFERVIPETDPEPVHALLRRYDRLHKRLRKKFLMLQPEALEISRKWDSGDEIHPEDTFDFLCDLRRGYSEDQKIFVRKKRNTRDIAMALLIDASSSTASTVGGRTVLDIEKAAVALLASALEGIGDVFGIFAFSSRGRDQVGMQVIKRYDEGWNDAVRGRISAIKSADSNRDGCAVRHIASGLAQRPEKSRLFLMLSDGIPADVGYGARSGAETSEYAIEDTRRALADCRLQGIVPYCLTIDAHAKEYIPHLYGSYNYSVIQDVEQLPERLSKLYLRITR